jgi:hypothetical protein
MRPRIALLSLSMLTLAACSTERGFLPSAEKVIAVDLRHGEIAIDDDPAIADITQSAIKWKLTSAAKSAGCTFPRNGIEFDPNPGSPPGHCLPGDPVKSFKNCMPLGPGETFQCVRRNFYEPGACYKYTARLNCNSATPKDHDPWVKNQQ